MNILFSGGGTGGHIIPALAIAEALRKKYPDAKIGFVSRSEGKENELIKRAGIPLYTIPIRGLERRFTMRNISHVRQAIKAKSLAKDIIVQFKADIIIGTGGYVCWPMISAGHELSVPTVMHESNAVPGLTTRLLSKKVNLLLLGTKNENIKKGVFVGNPIRGDFDKYTRAAARHSLGVGDTQQLIVSVGGSIGADRINSTLLCVMQEYSLPEPDICHLHSTGHRYYEQFCETMPQLCRGSCGVRAVPFINDMPKVLAAADLVISRCGAMTLSEIAYLGIPAILIPSPNVTGDHQMKNALYYQRHGAAEIIPEKDLDADTLIKKIRELLSDGDRLKEMSESIKKLSVGNAKNEIAELIADTFFAED